MARNKDAIWRLISQKRPQSTHLCRNCLSAAQSFRHNSSRESSSSAAAAASPSLATDPPSELAEFNSSQTNPNEAPSTSALPYKISAAVLLSRPPVLTRDLTPFEKAFFLYQRRLNERLSLPFTRYFYYERNTPGETEWKRKIKDRLTPARDIGRYSGYGSEAWNDEVVSGSDLVEPDVQKEALVRDAEVEVKKRNEAGEEEIVREAIERPMPRTTKADQERDLRSLNRALTRTLYLLVKRREVGKVPDGEWMFPEAELVNDESLHVAAHRIIKEGLGTRMNTWVVGKTPISHHIFNYPATVIEKSGDSGKIGEKAFYMKARVMAGKAVLDDNKLGLLDYQWLAKEEIQKVVSPFHWSAVKNILAER